MLFPTPDTNTADAAGVYSLAVDPESEIVFLRHLGEDDVYHRGPISGGAIFILPGIWTGMPAELLTVMRLRRLAGLTGRCPECDSCVQVSSGLFEHEHDCRVRDEWVHQALFEWRRRVGLYARGRRIQETPAVSP